MRAVPETANRKDWPRLVSNGVASLQNGKQDADIGTRTVTAAVTASVGEGLILGDATSAAFTVTLPAASDARGRKVTVKKIDASANVVTIDGDGAETIDGAATQSLSAQYASFTLVSDGTEWWIV